MDNPTIPIFIFKRRGDRNLARASRALSDFPRDLRPAFVMQHHPAALTSDGALRGNTELIFIGRLQIQNAVPSHFLLRLGQVSIGSSVR
jgi:hypothetical protein